MILSKCIKILILDECINKLFSIFIYNFKTGNDILKDLIDMGINPSDLSAEDVIDIYDIHNYNIKTDKLSYEDSKNIILYDLREYLRDKEQGI